MIASDGTAVALDDCMNKTQNEKRIRAMVKTAGGKDTMKEKKYTQQELQAAIEADRKLRGTPFVTVFCSVTPEVRAWLNLNSESTRRVGRNGRFAPFLRKIIDMGIVEYEVQNTPKKKP